LNSYGYDREHIFTSVHTEIFNNNPIYDSSVSDSWEGSKGGDVELMLVAEMQIKRAYKINHYFPFT
jgi:hypothetical protein